MATKEDLDLRVLSSLKGEVERAQGAVDWYESLKPCCRMFHSSLLSRFYISALITEFEQDIVRTAPCVWRCAKCGNVVLDES